MEVPVRRMLVEELDAGHVAVQERDDRALAVVVERLVGHAVAVDSLQSSQTVVVPRSTMYNQEGGVSWAKVRT